MESSVAERHFNLFLLIVCLFAIPLYLVGVLIDFFSPDFKSPAYFPNIEDGVATYLKEMLEHQEVKSWEHAYRQKKRAISIYLS